MNDASPINLGEVKSFDYIAEANVTASNNFHGDKVPLYWFQGALFNAIKAIEQLDAIKKTLFYGRELTGLPEQHAITTGCQHLPGMVDPEDLKRGELLLHSIVGTVTEAGEQLEMLSNVLFNGAKFDDVNFIEEIGDGFWYAAIGLKQVNATFGDVQHRNIAKLRHRFPQKFTEYDANNRDLFGERKILEMQLQQSLPEGYRHALTDGEGNVVEVTDRNGLVKIGPDDMREAWECKIGSRNGVHIPYGADFPMRQAVREAYTRITGEQPEALFSGWGATFTEAERAVIENHLPVLDKPE